MLHRSFNCSSDSKHHKTTADQIHYLCSNSRIHEAALFNLQQKFIARIHELHPRSAPPMLSLGLSGKIALESETRDGDNLGH
ncbi:hypothetical protein M0R45_022215 [Rubus argutus]|uniref:Uncharacterized protein n=1 Tax=Rubus argutus TaxID=59490 RepID=A0AAW1XDS7_RUBAR